MIDKKQKPLPPFLFPGKTSTERRHLAELKASGKVRQIGPRLYTSLPASEIAVATRASWSLILSELFPDSILSHRSAFEYKPSPAGEIFLTATTNRTITYPGLQIVFVRGPGPLNDDAKFLNLRASSQARLLLENLSARARGKSRTVPVEQIEERLEQILRDGGPDRAEDELNRIRDRAREISKKFGWKKEFQALEKIIGALLRTRPSGHLKTRLTRARASGEPYDPICLERLQLLFGELRGRAFPNIDERFKGPEHLRNKPFFEAYFSNYIEGPTFEIEEAEEIIFEHKLPAQRPKDAHDILGTFSLVSDMSEMRRTPSDFVELRELLSERHRTLMEFRPEASPGQFKEKPNRAGESVFVPPELVHGTLRKGSELLSSLPNGLARAIFVMFLVAEVHPFVEGNGRIARIMMNSELVASSLSTIIVPTVYREDYLLALRALTRRHRTAPLVDMLLRAQRFSHLEFSPYPKILKDLERRNWFREPGDGQIIE